MTDCKDPTNWHPNCRTCNPYIDFEGTIGDLKNKENLIGLEIVIEYERFLQRSRHLHKSELELVNETLLIGHVNDTDGGSCSCCGSFTDKTKVVKYRRIYDPKLTPKTIVIQK